MAHRICRCADRTYNGSDSVRTLALQRWRFHRFYRADLAIGAARSIRVGTGIWEACAGANFTGECGRLTPGEYRELGDQFGDTVLSARDVTYDAGSGTVGDASPRIQL